MGAFVKKSNLNVAAELADFVENAALPGTGVDAGAFWAGFSDLVHTLGPKNRALLAKREDIQAKVDAWHVENRDAPHDAAAYKAYLQDIGYLVPEGIDFPARAGWRDTGVTPASSAPAQTRAVRKRRGAHRSGW